MFALKDCMGKSKRHMKVISNRTKPTPILKEPASKSPDLTIQNVYLKSLQELDQLISNHIPGTDEEKNKRNGNPKQPPRPDDRKA